MSTLVSVIMAAKNPGPYIQSAVNSVIQQSYKEWELIVVDDGSDSSIRELVPEHQNVTVIRQDGHGVSAARNRGILESKGNYIAFIDSDDLWLPTKLEKQVALMDADPAVGLCYTERNVINSHGQVTSDDEVPAGAAESDDLKTPNGAPYVIVSEPCNSDAIAMSSVCNLGITTSTVMLRRDVLALTGLFDVLLKFSEDYDMWIKCARFFKCARIRSLEASYRWHGENSMSHYKQALEFDREMFQKFDRLACLRKDGRLRQVVRTMHRRARAGYARIAFNHCRSSLRQGNVVKALYHFIWATRLDVGFVCENVKLWWGNHLFAPAH
ncbi:MAG TPA: glycosyltransferase [Trichormus sp.]